MTADGPGDPLPAGIGKYVRDLRTLPHDLSLAWRRGGWVDALRQIGNRSVFRLVRAGRFRIVEVDLDTFRGRTCPSGIRTEPVTRENWSRFAELIPKKDRERYREYDASETILVAAFRGGSPVGYLWGRWDGANEDVKRGLPVPSGTAYLSYLFVATGERRKGIGSGLVTAAVRRARSRGYGRAWMLIRGSNEASLAAARRLTAGEAELRGRWRYLKLGPRVLQDVDLHEPRPLSPPGPARSATSDG